MLVKLSDEVVSAIGAKNVAEASTKLSEYVAETNRIKTLMSENNTAFEALEKRIKALEDRPAASAVDSKALEPAVKGMLVEFSASEAFKVAVKAEAKAEASLVVTQAMAAIGTTPAKPSPAPAAIETKAFAQIVQAGMDAGKTKSAAITAAMTSNPKEYQEYLKTGGSL